MRTARIKEGYGTIQRDIMTMKGLSVHAKAIYALFVSYSGQKDCCYPSLGTIRNNLDISVPTIIKGIKELEALQLLTVERTLGEASIYYPNYILVAEAQSVSPRIPEEKKVPEQPFEEIAGKPVYIGFEDFSDEQGRQHTGFWNLYDKKVDKQKARRLWNKLKANTRAFIMQKVPLYKSYQADKQYRKSPYSYLLNQCWDDEDLHKPRSYTKGPNQNSENGRLSISW